MTNIGGGYQWTTLEQVPRHIKELRVLKVGLQHKGSIPSGPVPFGPFHANS